MSNDESLLHDVINRCKRAGFTGVVFVRSDEGLGQISFVAGVLDESRVGAMTGDAALAKLRSLKSVTLDVHVRLPESKGLAVAFEGGLNEHAPVEIFHYCEDHALTCVVELRSGGIKGIANYVLGELTDVSCGGDARDIAVTNMIGWKEGTYRIVLPGVELPAGVTYQAPKLRDEAEEARKAAEAKKEEEAKKAETERKLADARKAAEARRAEDALRAEEAKRRVEELRKAAEAKRRAEEQKKAEEARVEPKPEEPKPEEPKPAAPAKVDAETSAAEEARKVKAAKKAAKATRVEEEKKAAKKAKAEEDARAREEEKAALEKKAARKSTAPAASAKPSAEEPKDDAPPAAPAKKSALPMIVFLVIAIAVAAFAYMKFLRK